MSSEHRGYVIAWTAELALTPEMRRALQAGSTQALNALRDRRRAMRLQATSPSSAAPSADRSR